MSTYCTFIYLFSVFFFKILHVTGVEADPLEISIDVIEVKFFPPVSVSTSRERVKKQSNSNSNSHSQSNSHNSQYSQQQRESKYTHEHVQNNHNNNVNNENNDINGDNSVVSTYHKLQMAPAHVPLEDHITVRTISGK